jgi:hypothetical protein
MSIAKKPLPIFVVAFEGTGVYPERIPVETLTRTLSAVGRLAQGAAVAENEDEETDEEEGRDEELDSDVSIRLLDIQRGSAVFRFVGPSPGSAVTNLREAGRVIEDPEEIGENDYILRPLDRLSTTARRLRCHIVVREPSKGGPILARIGPKSYEEVSRSVFITGETTIAGTVKRVGGTTEMRCALRVAFQHRLLFCKVQTAELARRMGDHLYEDVVVQGLAKWIKNTWRVADFTVTNVHQPEQGSVFDALNAFREAGGHAWDKIRDPKAFLEGANGT